jgi:predicted PurR-regulated permease PerM
MPGDGPVPGEPVFDLIGRDEAPGKPAEPLVRQDASAEAPAWVMPVIRKAVWRLVLVVIGVAIAFTLLTRARGVVGMLVVALFFGIAMDPAVTWLHQRKGWKRGAATGMIFLVLATFTIVMIFVLIPAIIQMANVIADKLPDWIANIQQAFGIDPKTADNNQIADDLQNGIKEWLQNHGGELLGIAGSTLGAVFNFFTIAMFTFYFAADAPRIRRAVLTRFPPQKQGHLGWAWDTAIIQTGGYFYSRMLLVLINGSLFFFVMVAVGTPWELALPLSVFEGFVAEFIPAVGTYIGAAIPIMITLGLLGVVPAAILLGWTLIYQQLENYILSPRLSARTMELNGGVAFGSALAGGAMFGPMGAFMSLPVAAMITSFMKNYSPKYELAYTSSYDDIEAAEAEAAQAAEQVQAPPKAGRRHRRKASEG